MRLTVLMAVYNGVEELPHTLDSLLEQNYANFELLIVDDGSSDGSAELAKSYGDPRIRILRQENQGLTRALNNGIQQARGEYIARMDCGDLCHPNRLERQLQFLDNRPEILLVGCRIRRLSAEREVLGISEVIQEPARIHQGLLKINLFQHSSIMVRRSALQAVGGYRSFFRCSQDYDLFLRLSELGPLANLPDVLSDWVMEPESISFRKRRLQAAYAEIARTCARDRRSGRADPVDAGRITAPDCADLNPAERTRAYKVEVARAALMGENPERARQELLSLRNQGALRLGELSLILYSFLPLPIRTWLRERRLWHLTTKN